MRKWWGAIVFVTFVARSAAAMAGRQSVLNQIEWFANSIDSHLETSARLDAVSLFACQGRLSLVTGVAVTTTDQDNLGTLYFTPYLGSELALFDGTNWSTPVAFTEISVALSGTSANTNYDVFLYNSSGTITFHLEAWASDTARNVALTLQDGAYIHSTSTNYRYIGTIRTTNANQTSDSSQRRFVWNYCQRVPRFMQRSETTNSWNGTGANRQTNGDTNNRFEYVMGLNEEPLIVTTMMVGAGDATLRSPCVSSAALDSTTQITESIRGGSVRNTFRQQYWSRSQSYGGIGYHAVNWFERGPATTVFYGDDAGDARLQSGMLGWIRG